MNLFLISQACIICLTGKERKNNWFLTHFYEVLTRRCYGLSDSARQYKSKEERKALTVLRSS